MNDFQKINDVLKKNEKEITTICSPFNGNCFEVAYALSQIFESNMFVAFMLNLNLLVTKTYYLYT